MKKFLIVLLIFTAFMFGQEVERLNDSTFVYHCIGNDSVHFNYIAMPLDDINYVKASDFDSTIVDVVYKWSMNRQAWDAAFYDSENGWVGDFDLEAGQPYFIRALGDFDLIVKGDSVSVPPYDFVTTEPDTNLWNTSMNVAMVPIGRSDLTSTLDIWNEIDPACNKILKWNVINQEWQVDSSTVHYSVKPGIPFAIEVNSDVVWPSTKNLQNVKELIRKKMTKGSDSYWMNPPYFKATKIIDEYGNPPLDTLEVHYQNDSTSTKKWKVTRIPSDLNYSHLEYINPPGWLIVYGCDPDIEDRTMTNWICTQVYEVEAGIYCFDTNNCLSWQESFKGSFCSTCEESPSLIENRQIPSEIMLYQCYPNPFNPETTIEFAIPKESAVSLKVYNTVGQLVQKLVNRRMDAGFYAVDFNAGNLNSGVYYYTLEVDGEKLTKKMVLMK